MNARPDNFFEQRAKARGSVRVAGIDEAGRGAWAGPVVAAAAIFDSVMPPPPGLNDSKKLTPQRRAMLFAQLHRDAHFGVGIVEAGVIDANSITGATRQAMQQAVAALDLIPDHFLIDGCDRFGSDIAGEASFEMIIRGDMRSISIAAASIIAKVTRDRLMISYDAVYPGYGFACHKGYGTAQHRAALARFGATPLHRRSYRPVAELTE